MCIFSVECIARIMFDIDCPIGRKKQKAFTMDLIKKTRLDDGSEVINIIDLIHNLCRLLPLKFLGHGFYVFSISKIILNQ